mgnify:CR=1 FL=1
MQIESIIFSLMYYQKEYTLLMQKNILEKNKINIKIEYDDLEIINKNTVDFNSFSYYYSNCTGEKINKKG